MACSCSPIELGTLGNFNVKADWYYLDYRVRDWLGVRAGRLKIAYGLYNDVSDIDAARAPALLPSSVYPFTNREYLLAQTGGELYGYATPRSRRRARLSGLRGGGAARGAAADGRRRSPSRGSASPTSPGFA